MPPRNRAELMQLRRAKSMMRYLPPNTTAGLARSSARMLRRSPRPPARIRASTRLMHSPRFSAPSRGLQGRAGLRVHVTASEGGVHLQMIAQITGDEEVGAHVFAAGGAHAVGFLGVPHQVEDALGAGGG